MKKPSKIYNSEQGFDSRLSKGKGLWGTGTYFAVRAAYSDTYAYTNADGHKQMLMAKVITGITHKCLPNDKLRAPPIKPALSNSIFEEERYDSVSGYTVNTKNQGSDIFIIYDQGKAYAEYLITYCG